MLTTRECVSALQTRMVAYLLVDRADMVVQDGLRFEYLPTRRAWERYGGSSSVNGALLRGALNVTI